MIPKTTWFTEKMKTYSKSTQELIARMKYGGGPERFNEVMRIIKQSKTEQEVVEKLELLDLQITDTKEMS